MFSLRIEFLTGRYVASEFNNRAQAEWPPHPARVFSALVAAHYNPHPVHLGEAALQWLESQPAPSLTFSAASHRDVKTHFVPVNDRALRDGSIIDNAWRRHAEAGLSDKQRAAAEAKLTKAYEKQGSRTEKLGKHFRAEVNHVLPQGRTRQARYFPCVIPESPVVWLTWPSTPPPGTIATLEEIALRMIYLGHSSCLIAATWSRSAPPPTWFPTADGSEALRWVGPGQLSALDILFERAPSGEQRVMPYTVARYAATQPAIPVDGTCFSPEMIVFRRRNGPRLSLVSTGAVCEAVRHALMKHASQPLPGLISGHGPDGGPLQDDHLAVVALPHVASRHATGDLLGVAVVLPRHAEDADIQALYRAISSWEQAEVGLAENRNCALTLGRLGKWTLERCIEFPPLANLRDATWTRPSEAWASVTPMVLDRHPGDLHHSRSTLRQRAVNHATETMRSACQRIGLPAPEEVEFSTTPFLSGSLPAVAFRSAGKRTEQRPFTHVRLQFAEPIRGPVLLGAHRYRGIGLFRPVGSTDRG